ncbi:BTAD domain-containing putative transcriptional regulator [Streptomyces sp. NPDC021562]|uniref:AfsR/SARP family transcriptional regulator n=1 Tax=Streptomyces sp. NPDC021562 TaxID=3155121 RepID=UPI0033FED107
MWLTVMGPVRAWQDNVELDLGPAKRQALLALLLVRTGQPTSLGTIIDVLWEQEPPHSAANVVYRHAAAIRRLLESGDQSADRRAARLTRVSGSYRLDASAASLDLLNFRELTRQARASAAKGAMRESVRLLARALRLSKGPIASGILPHVAQHPYFVAVEGEHLAAVKEAAGIAARLGEPGAVLDVLQPAAVQHPLDEMLQAQLVQALAASGRQAEALRAYHAVRAHLDQQLGIAPGPELRSAYEDLLLRGAQAAPPLPGAVVPAPRRPNPRPTVPRALPGQRTSRVRDAVPPGRLPATPEDFVGRETELAFLGALSPADEESPLPARAPEPVLSGPEGHEPDTDSCVHRVPAHPVARVTTPVAVPPPPVPAPVVAVVGPAGIGKTALVVRAGHRSAARSTDRQVFVDLQGHSLHGTALDPEEALRRLLVALGTPEHRVPAGLRARTALYRAQLAGRRVLVVLDDARDARQVQPLLPRSPGSVALVTSRDPLDELVTTEGAHRLALGPLEPAHSRATVILRLGAERADAEPEAVAELAASCAGVPLALTLAGSAAALRPETRLAVLAAELRGHRATTDGSGPAGAAATADTVRGVLAWSYGQLAADTARMFRLLALHTGPDIGVTAAASLAGVPPEVARALLDDLVRARLLDAPERDSYHLHTLLHELALRLCLARDPEDLRRLAVRRMLDHYVHTAREAALLLTPHRNVSETLPAPQPRTSPEPLGSRAEAAAWLDRRLLPVLSAVVAEAAELGLHAHVRQLALALELPLDRRARWAEQIALQRTCLRTAELQGDLTARARAHRALGFAHGRLGRHTDAHTHLRRALTLFAEAEDHQGQAAVHRCIAFRANAAARHRQALDHYHRSLELYRRAADTIGEADVRNDIGWTYLLQGDYAAALDPCERAAELFRAAGHLPGEATAHDSLGYAHHHLGTHDRALDHYDRALALHRELDDRYLEATTLIHIGHTRLARGERAGATRAWQEALALLDALRHPDARDLRRKLNGAG